MFDQNVESEGLGRAEEAFAKQRAPSPDGLGSSGGGMGAYMLPEPAEHPGSQHQPMYPPAFASPGGQFQMPPQAPPMQPQPGYGQPMAGELPFLEPEDTSQGAAVRSAGFTLLFVALSTGLGYAWKGGHGAISGLLVSAGAANAYRSQKWFSSSDPSEKHEAIVSGLFAAAEIFGGLFVGYHAIKRSEK